MSERTLVLATVEGGGVRVSSSFCQCGGEVSETALVLSTVEGEVSERTFVLATVEGEVSKREQ